KVRDALPKMYHQPIGPAALRGMGCVSIGTMVSRTLIRASNQSVMIRNHFMVDSSAYLASRERERPEYSWIPREHLRSLTYAPGSPQEFPRSVFCSVG